MEDQNISSAWKSQSVISEISTGVNFKNRSVADELTLLRDKHLKLRLRALPVSLLILAVSGHSIYRYYIGEGGVIGVVAAGMLITAVLLGYYQLYRLYQWRQAEIFTDTRHYLMMSRNIIAAYIKNTEIAQYAALCIFPLFIVILYYTVAPLKFGIYTAVLSAMMISAAFRTRTMNKSMHSAYNPIIQRIDSTLKLLELVQ